MKVTRLLFQKTFIDKVKLSLCSGNGANGNPRFRGKGGNGGNIFVVANNKSKLEDILDIYPGSQIKAQNGKECSKTNIIGQSGDDIIINAPTGIEILLKSGDLLGTLNNTGDKMIVCRGGSGGGPLNNYMATTGEQLIADVGLVGFPNAGKSSFLKSISGASTRIASYAFTTLKPQVANVNYSDGRFISMADLPGIIEGAHVNVGLGHHFLKHVERTKLLLFVIDIFGFKLQSRSLKTAYRSPLETILLLNQELEIYNPKLLDKPCICLLNKVDQKEGDEISQFVMETIADNKLRNWMNEEICPQNLVKFDKIIPISAKENKGIEDVKIAIRNSLDQLALAQIDHEKFETDLDKEFSESTQSMI